MPELRGKKESMRKIYFASIFLTLLLLVSFSHYVITTALGSEVHDVAVIDVTVFPTKIVGAGDVITNVILENQGTSIETFNITLYASYESFRNDIPYASGNLTILNFTITDLEPGSNTNITLKWSAFPWRLEIWPPPLWSWQDLLIANFTVRVEADVVPGEVDTSDNIFIDGTITVFWKVTDFNGDGKIDIKDIAVVASAFGSSPEDPDWNPIIDINQDGKIDIRDIAPTAKCFGTFYG